MLKKPSVKKGYVDLPEGQVHYRACGSGEAMLLLHQTPASSRDYLALMPLLAQKFRVIAVDTLGYGGSDYPAAAPSIDLYARVNRDFLAALGIKQAHLFGHHTGASIAVEMAAAYPELALSLGLSGCPVYEDEVRAARLHSTVPMQPGADGSYLMAIWQVIRRYNPLSPVEFWHQHMADELLAGPRHEDGHIAVFNYDIARRLPLIACPVLLMTAGNDVFTPQMDSTAKLIPGCRTAVIEGADAMVLLEKPGEIAALLFDFLGK